MTSYEFQDFLHSLPTLSPFQLCELKRALGAIEALPFSTCDQDDDQALQRRLLAAGLLSEIKPPRTPTGTESFVPITIEGEPLSETIIRERR